MWKLMKLEWKKNNMKKYVGKAAVVTVIIFLMIFATSGELNEVETVEIYGKSMIGAGVDMFANMAFMLCTAAMLSSLIISAYQNKTMNLMFSYPIRRQKILLSQMLVVWLFNFCALVLCKLLVYGGLVLVSPLAHIAAGAVLPGGTWTDMSFYINMLVNSAIMVSVSYTALLVGMRMKSSKAAIVAACIVMLLTQGNIGSFTLIYNIPFYTGLVVLSDISVFSCVHGVETRDVV